MTGKLTYLSAETEKFACIAANAMTVLNYARVPFSGMNLSNIKIPGADLIGGIFDHTDLSSANLTEVKFDRAFLGFTNLNDSNMKNVDLGQLPTLLHSREVRCVCYNFNGSLLATCSGKKIKIWCCEDYSLFLKLDHFNEIKSMSFGADSSLLAAGDKKGSVFLYYLSPNKKDFIHEEIQPEATEIEILRVSSTGSMLAILNERNLLIWSLVTKKIVHYLEGFYQKYGYIRTIDFNRDEKFLAIGGDKNKVSVWNLRSEKLIQVMQEANLSLPAFTVYSVRFMPLSTNLLAVAASDEGLIYLWNIEIPEVKLKLNHKMVEVICFNSNGAYLVSASSLDKTIKLWDMEQGKLIYEFYGHSDNIKDIGYSPDGKVIASADASGDVRLWLTRRISKSSSKQIFWENISQKVDISSDGKLLASIGINPEDDYYLYLWQVETSHLYKMLKGSNQQAVTCVNFSPNNNLIASGGDYVSIWNIDTGECLKTLTNPDAMSMDFSTNSQLLACGNFDKFIYLWNIEKGESVYSLKGHEMPLITNVCFSPDSLKLASAGKFEGNIYLWDLVESKLIHTINSGQKRVDNLFFHSNGNVLISAFNDEIYFWNIQGDAVTQIKALALNIYVNYLRFDGANNLLAIGGSSGEIYLFDIDSNKCQVLLGHSGNILKLAFKKNEITSVGSDSSIKKWKLQKSSENQRQAWYLSWTNYASFFSAHCKFDEDSNTLSSMNKRLLKQMTPST